MKQKTPTSNCVFSYSLCGLMSYHNNLCQWITLLMLMLPLKSNHTDISTHFLAIWADINWLWWLWRSKWVTVTNTLCSEHFCYQLCHQIQSGLGPSNICKHNHTHKHCQSNTTITEGQCELSMPQTLQIMLFPADRWGLSIVQLSLNAASLNISMMLAA